MKTATHLKSLKKSFAKKLLLLILLLGISTLVFTQEADRLRNIENQLFALVVDQPGLDETIESSVSNVSITEYLRSIGINHNLNINVSNKLDQKLINNFSNAKVADVILFLCKEYSLDMEVTGGIISIKKYIAPVEEKIVLRRLPKVDYTSQTGFLSLDLKKDSLDLVAREITSKSLRNVVLSPELGDLKVSAFIQNRPFEDALEKMCFANGLKVEKDGNFYLISKIEELAQKGKTKTSGKGKGAVDSDESEGEIEIVVKEELLTVYTKDAEISSIIAKVSREVDQNYFIYAKPEGVLSIYIENATYEQFLSYLLHGTDNSFTIQNEVYLIGSSNSDIMKTTELIQLKNRTIENVLSSSGGRNTRSNTSSSSGGTNNTNSGNSNRGNRNSGSGANASQFFSPDLKIQPFPELNAFIISGSFPEVKAFKDFIHQIDQVVPVVMIEVLIVDVNKNRTFKAGVNAGLGENAGETSGRITGDGQNQGLNIDMSTQSINNLLNTFNGYGIVNLGNVSPNFYLNIQALEADGVLKMRSTPKLATLNSYTASLKIGRKEYYLETKTNVNTSAASNLVTEQQIWQPIEADLSIEITPVVSGAEQVTLEISVTQSNFTDRSGDNGPFGTVNREFSSSIRVKNGEMILLGGLEDKSNSNSGGGLPFLSRIPVIKWLFGSRSKTKDSSKLNIFIKPTIIY